MADEKDMQIDELKNKNAELQAKVSELEAKIAKQEKDEKDQKFSQFLHSFVPEGMKATDEQRKELREKYDKDVVSLMFSIKTETEKAGSGETKRVGEEYSEVKNSVQTNTTVGDLCLRNFKDED